jgi:hypothetical protein
MVKTRGRDDTKTGADLRSEDPIIWQRRLFSLMLSSCFALTPAGVPNVRTLCRLGYMKGGLEPFYSNRARR